MKKLLTCLMLTGVVIHATHAQSILPPLIPWKGKSEGRMVSANNAFITPFERSNGTQSASRAELNQFLSKLQLETPLIRIDTIGISAEGRPIQLVKVSSDINFLTESPARSSRPTLLVQAGIHSGEIDGKDAGMMLIRELLLGKNKKLIDEVNLLFIPILNVDGHERASTTNRMNQRGPVIQGWRTNAQNLNLNRDYSKLDTEEIQAVLSVINKFDPDLYLDIHVTDGADYQYDITYGFNGNHGYSPETSNWLNSIYKPFVDRSLKEQGHIPGPLVFAKNGVDFTEGNAAYTFSPRFSNGYGDARHLPTILVENHSLKPFKQRVLGDLILLETTMTLLANVGYELENARKADLKKSKPIIPLSWKFPESTTDSVLFSGIVSSQVPSKISGKNATNWSGKAIQQKIPYWSNNLPVIKAAKPIYYLIPSGWKEVIKRIKMHGFTYEMLTQPETIELEMYRFEEIIPQDKTPFQGRMRLKGRVIPEKRKQEFPAGSIRLFANQDLGDLLVLLMEPDSEDSFFQWGFFSTIMERTEYFEAYAMEKLANDMLVKSPALKAEFEQKLLNDKAFAETPIARLHWFYEKSDYTDEQYLLYPVGIKR
jgi:hypothetical protein